MKLLVLIVLYVHAGVGQEIKKTVVPGRVPLVVSVYFEGDCPDCHEFFRDQLVQAWQGPLQPTLDLVPFGNAEQRNENGRWRFSCQHGAEECLHNKLYACAIRQACGEGGTADCARERVDQILKYILCVIIQPDQAQYTAQCTSELADLTADYILRCARSEEGSVLLSGYGNRTAAATPAVMYVPHVSINGEHDTAAEEDLISRLSDLNAKLNNQESKSLR